MTRAHTILVMALMARQDGITTLVGSHILNLDNSFELGPVGVPRCQLLSLGIRVKSCVFVCGSVSTYLTPSLPLLVTVPPLIPSSHTRLSRTRALHMHLRVSMHLYAFGTNRNVRSQSLILLLALPAFSSSVRCVCARARTRHVVVALEYSSRLTEIFKRY
jgi:hypothetical protein